MPKRSERGRPREVDLRMIVNAIFYLAATGCQWRSLPKDFPPYSTVQYYFYAWRASGLWERMNSALVRRMRRRQGTQAYPFGRDHRQPEREDHGKRRAPRGFDMAKKVKGRKRHIVTDTEGSLLAVPRASGQYSGQPWRRAAVAQHRPSLPQVALYLRRPRLSRAESCSTRLADLGTWTIEIVTRSQSVGTFKT